MNIACFWLASAFLAADDAATPTAQEKLQAMHLQEGARWQMFLDKDRHTKAVLNTKPIYIWTNPLRSHGQHGSVFVWTHRGRPVVVGSIFSHPELERRMICHEFHSLSEGPLLPERGPGEERWEPKAPVKMLPLVGAASPDTSPARRLLQMRSLAREFTAHSIDYMEERWELRLLSQPLYRYEKPEGEVLDGALFAFVTSAGTDPEVVLVLESRQMGEKPAWYYRAIRFSDSNLYVQHRGKEIWTSIRDDKNQLYFNPDHTYRLIRDKQVDELPELAEVIQPAVQP